MRFRLGSIFLAVVLGVASVQAAETSEELYRDAFVAFKLAHYDEANGACDRALAVAPQDGRATLLKGRIAAAQGRRNEAHEWIEKAITIAPTNSNAHRALADLLFHEREYEAARVAYLDAQRYGDTDPDLPLLLFYCDVGLKNWTEAEKAASGFNAFDEKNPAYYFAKAALAQAHGQGEEARKALQNATLLYGDAGFAAEAPNYYFLFPETAK